MVFVNKNLLIFVLLSLVYHTLPGQVHVVNVIDSDGNDHTLSGQVHNVIDSDGNDHALSAQVHNVIGSDGHDHTSSGQVHTVNVIDSDGSDGSDGYDHTLSGQVHNVIDSDGHDRTSSGQVHNVTSSDGKECAIKVDGCSIPGKLPFFYKTKFTPACNKHDVCYGCGKHYSWSREECDNSFRNDMDYLCSNASTSNFIGSIIESVRKLVEAEEARCRGFSSLYYHTVDTFGRYRYIHNPPKWCYQPCVLVYGSPHRRLGQGYDMA